MIARECAGGGRAPNCCFGSNKSDKSKSAMSHPARVLLSLSLPCSLSVSLGLVNKLSCGRKRMPISRNWNIVAIGNCQETWLQVGPRVELHTSSLFFLYLYACGYANVCACVRVCECVCVWNKCEKQTTSSSADQRLRRCLLCVCALLESVGARASTPPRTVVCVLLLLFFGTITVNSFCYCYQALSPLLLSKNGLSNKNVDIYAAMPISDKI